MKTIDKLVNHQHKFQLFLEKPSSNNRSLHINRIVCEIHALHGIVHEVVYDYNELFDSIKVSWTKEWFDKQLMNPLSWICHFYCVQATKKLSERSQNERSES